MQVISPNWHVIFIHYPIALLSVGLIIEVLGLFLWRRSSVRTAGRWMILIGALSCIPALLTGLYAFADVSTPIGSQMGADHWHAMAANSPLNMDGGEPWVFLRRHILLNAIATGILCLVVIGWIGSTDRCRRKIYSLYLFLVIVAMGFLVAGAWNGGESIYRFGVAVDGQGKAALPAADSGAFIPPDIGHGWRERLQYFIPPLELHTLLAGIVVALAVVALGLSIRAITSDSTSGESTETRQTSVDPLTGQTTTITTGESAEFRNSSLAAQTDLESALRTTGPRASPSVPAGRWWLLAMLIAILTGAAGVWASEWFDWATIRGSLWPLSADTQRFFVHTVCGSAIVILTLLLAIGAKWARRNKIYLSIVAGLLVIAIGLQMTVGILMLYDTPAGPLTGFAKPQASTK